MAEARHLIISGDKLYLDQDGKHYYQCEDCDSTYMYYPLNCEFCSSPHLIQLELEDYEISSKP